MSRSYKKPWVKDPSNSYMKKIHARRMRRIINQILTKLKEEKEKWDIGPDIPDYREITNPYNVCDFIMYWKDKKATRK